MVAASPGELSIADQEELLSNWHNQKRTWALGDELILKIRRLAELSFKHSGSATVYDRLTSVVNTLEADLESDGKGLPRTFPGLLSDTDADSTYLSTLFKFLLKLIQEQGGLHQQTRTDVGKIRLYDIVCVCAALDDARLQNTSGASDAAASMSDILKQAESIHKDLLDSMNNAKATEPYPAAGSGLIASGISAHDWSESGAPTIKVTSATDSKNMTLSGDTFTIEPTTTYNATTATTHQPSVVTLKGIVSTRRGQRSEHRYPHGRDSGYGSGRFSPEKIQSPDWAARDDATASQVTNQAPSCESSQGQESIRPSDLSLSSGKLSRALSSVSTRAKRRYRFRRRRSPSPPSHVLNRRER